MIPTFIRQSYLFPWLVLLALSGCTKPQAPQQDRFIDPRSERYLQIATAALEQHEFDTALALADSAARFTAASPDVAFLKGRIHSELGAFDEAESAYREALKYDANYRGIWHNLGNNAFRRHQYDDAIGYYRKELAQNPAPIPWRGIGRAYVELGKVDSARIAFDQALAIDSLYAPAHFNLALLYEDEGAHEIALDHARKAFEVSPQDLDFQYLMASLMVTTGRHAAAIPHLKAVTDAWPWHHASHYKLGQAFTRNGDRISGKAMLEKAESLRAQDANIVQLLNSARSAPQDPLPHAALGSALRLAGRYEDAMRAYKVARHLDPTNLDIQTNMASLHLLKGDTLATIQGYQAILQQDPGFIEIWLNLGVVYAISGQKAEAQTAWEQVLNLQPDNPAALSYLKRLHNTP